MLDPLRIGGRQIDLVHHRQDLQIVLHGQVGVGQSLGLHALGGIHHQDRAFAGRQRTGNLRVEVHMTRGIDEVQLVVLTVLGRIGQVHGPGFDGDAVLLFQFHIIQQLVSHLALTDGIALFQQAIRQGGLAVVDVGNDGKITDMRLIEHGHSS